MTAALMRETGLTDACLRQFVEDFYAQVRCDPVLGPIFAARLTEWEPHLARMTDFWSSVALMTGRYHGRPMEAHAQLPVDWSHFERWLTLFRQTATESFAPDGAAHLIARAERIARSLHIAVEDSRASAAPRLRPTDRGA
ncbi:group III truncated hemoglobin [Tropicimonas sp. IMCC6043]|nr:group III truncated hemoglobin [Tropicimonas sp. IMCC6043]